MQGQANINNQTTQDIKEIKSSLSALTASLRTQEKGKFPAQPQPNPATQCHVSSSSKTQVENANSITTLRSGKVIDKTIPPKDQKPDSLPTLEGNNDGKDKCEFVNNEHLEKENLVFLLFFLKDFNQLKI